MELLSTHNHFIKEDDIIQKSELESNLPNPQPLCHYQKEFKGIIPKEATKPANYKLIPMFIHVILIFTWIAMIIIFNSALSIVSFSILIGLSIACLFLYSHELSHGTIIRKQPYLYITQLFFWAFSGIPPTVWKRVHNMSHHHHMNTYKDPDRKTFKSEASFLNKLYNLFIYPNKTLRYSFTVGSAMMFYSTKHILAVFYSKDSRPSIVTHRPNYTKKEVKLVFIELMYILTFWGMIWIVLGVPIAIWVSLISWYTYSAAVILFIITQHQRDPVFIDIADPLLTSTSVIIPAWLDKIIDWHSFHVEHHLFPGINFDYYPQISQKIQEKYPNKYERIPLFQAVKEAYAEDVLIDDPLT